jgi:hypothetical protein
MLSFLYFLPLDSSSDTMLFFLYVYHNFFWSFDGAQVITALGYVEKNPKADFIG